MHHSARQPFARFHLLSSLAAAAAVGLAGCAAGPAVKAPPHAPAPVPASPAAAPAPAAPAPAAQDGAPVEQQFAQWVAEFRASARAAGIGEATLQGAFANVQYLPRVVELDRAQPEFTRSVWDYIDNAVTPQRVATGQQRLQQVHAEAEAAAARYGVPPAIVAAIWGKESNYGGN